jgi:hypothetical protein
MSDALTNAVGDIMVAAAAKAYGAKADPEQAKAKFEDSIVKVEDATSGQAAASTQQQPFAMRELKTTAELLKLKIDNLIREFERDTGNRIDTVRYTYYERGVQLHVRLNEPDEHGLSFFYL